jgi:hypothetical protein
VHTLYLQFKKLSKVIIIKPNLFILNLIRILKKDPNTFQHALLGRCMNKS